MRPRKQGLETRHNKAIAEEGSAAENSHREKIRFLYKAPLQIGLGISILLLEAAFLPLTRG